MYMFWRHWTKVEAWPNAVCSWSGTAHSVRDDQLVKFVPVPEDLFRSPCSRRIFFWPPRASEWSEDRGLILLLATFFNPVRKLRYSTRCRTVLVRGQVASNSAISQL